MGIHTASLQMLIVAETIGIVFQTVCSVAEWIFTVTDRDCIATPTAVSIAVSLSRGAQTICFVPGTTGERILSTRIGVLQSYNDMATGSSLLKPAG